MESNSLEYMNLLNLGYIAGDDNQAINRWAGADVKRFLNIKGNLKVLPISHRLPMYYS